GEIARAAGSHLEGHWYLALRNPVGDQVPQNRFESEPLLSRPRVQLRRDISEKGGGGGIAVAVPFLSPIIRRLANLVTFHAFVNAASHGAAAWSRRPAERSAIKVEEANHDHLLWYATLYATSISNPGFRRTEREQLY